MEYFSSFCLVQTNNVAHDILTLGELAEQCDARLRFWEIVYVAGESARSGMEAAGPALARIRNLRILFVSEDASHYRRRLVAAADAIGDVVTLTTPDELRIIDVVALAERAASTNTVVMARRTGRGLGLPVFHWALSLISPYRVSARDMHTIAISRARLVALLARSTAAIDLRFESKNGPFPYTRHPVEEPSPRSERGISHRFELFTEIVASSTPGFLKAFACLALLVVMLAIFYGFYAVGVLFLKHDVQPGWFSNAVTQSGSVAFIALSFAVVCLGIARIAEQMSGAIKGVIIDEVGTIGFFDPVHDRNVEVQHDIGPLADRT